MPMLRDAAALASERGWPCLVSVEEHMGCGYGVCRGCAVPMAGGGHCVACQDGPVLDAARVDWERFDRSGGAT
jgi:dihydroorotate dehydrogenase electron transfer subunit